MMMPSIVRTVRVTFAERLWKEETKLSESGTPPPPLRVVGGVPSRLVRAASAAIARFCSVIVGWATGFSACAILHSFSHDGCRRADAGRPRAGALGAAKGRGKAGGMHQ